MGGGPEASSGEVYLQGLCTRADALASLTACVAVGGGLPTCTQWSREGSGKRNTFFFGAHLSVRVRSVTPRVRDGVVKAFAPSLRV